MIFKVKLQVQPNTWKALLILLYLSPSKSVRVWVCLFIWTNQLCSTSLYKVDPANSFAQHWTWLIRSENFMSFRCSPSIFAMETHAKHSDTLRLSLHPWGTAPCALFFRLPNVSWISATFPTKWRKKQSQFQAVVATSCSCFFCSFSAALAPLAWHAANLSSVHQKQTLKSFLYNGLLRSWEESHWTCWWNFAFPSASVLPDTAKNVKSPRESLDCSNIFLTSCERIWSFMKCFLSLWRKALWKPSQSALSIEPQ